MVETKQVILFPVEPIISTPFLSSPASRKRNVHLRCFNHHPKGKVNGEKSKGICQPEKSTVPQHSVDFLLAFG
jgi:hypothetical protein